MHEHTSTAPPQLNDNDIVGIAIDVETNVFPALYTVLLLGHDGAAARSVAVTHDETAARLVWHRLSCTLKRPRFVATGDGGFHLVADATSPGSASHTRSRRRLPSARRRPASRQRCHHARLARVFSDEREIVSYE